MFVSIQTTTDDDEDYEDYDDEWETDSEDEGMPGEGAGVWWGEAW